MLPLVIASAGMSALSSIFGGVTARNAAKARASALEQGARQALQEGGVAAQMGYAADERAIAHATTLAAAGGGGFGGSNLNVLDDLARQQTFRARSTIYSAQREAYNLQTEARSARTEGQNAYLGGLISASGSMLRGFSDQARAKSAASSSRLGQG